MSSGRTFSSAFGSIQNCSYALVRRFCSCLNCRQTRRIYPANLDYGHNKFILFQSNTLIRVIHFGGTEGEIDETDDWLNQSYLDNSNQPKCDSLTYSFSKTDYGFTNWSKPLRLCDKCRRSFKNLWQKNASDLCFSKQFSVDRVERSFPILYESSTNELETGTSVEQFVDALVRQIIYDSLYTVCYINVKGGFGASVNFEKHKQSKNSMKLNNSGHSLSGDVEAISIRKDSQLLCSGASEFDSTPLFDIKGCSNSKQHYKSCRSNSSKNFVEDEVEHKEPSEEKYTYFNNSFSKTDEDMDTDCYKTEDKESVAANSLSICSHLKSKLPALVFVHGVGGSAEVWLHQLRHFARRGFCVAAPDLLGHGLSAAPHRPAAYAFARLVAHVHAVLDACVPPGTQCVLVAHAFGCSVAAALARSPACGARVALLVLVSGGGPTPLAPRGPDARPPRPAPWRRLLPLAPLLCCGFNREVVYAAPLGKHIGPSTPAAAAPAAAPTAPAHVLRHMAARAHMWPEGDAAFHRRITQPALLVHGLRDAHVSLPQMCDMERTIPRATLQLIPDAGHFAMLETPARLSHMIESFIDWWRL